MPTESKTYAAWADVGVIWRCVLIGHLGSQLLCIVGYILEWYLWRRKTGLFVIGGQEDSFSFNSGGT